MGVPDISIILTIVDGGEALKNCLHALRDQAGDRMIEVIVPYDHISKETEAHIAAFPQFEFSDLGVIADGNIPKDALELHRFWDIRRAEGLKVARGRIIGLVEDRGIPHLDWADQMVTLHDTHQPVAVGGAVDNGLDNLWNWAVHFCDFGRYQPPLFDENPEFLSATNVSYNRDALQSLAHLYDDHFYEPTLHAALKENGGKLLLADGPRCVQFRPRIGTLKLWVEWFHWGRKYGQIAGSTSSVGQRVKRCFMALLLPFVFYLRHLKRQFEKKHHIKEFLLASPLVFIIGLCWAIGEFAGYIQATPEAD